MPALFLDRQSRSWGVKLTAVDSNERVVPFQLLLPIFQLVTAQTSNPMVTAFHMTPLHLCPWPFSRKLDAIV
ncbi:hypothetical protein T10_4205 [Trichinella papuae]|uniref:Uncharacterized protein n=1 Tax=Trichinella papuae TaxID=268474 RepID=A0A0V1M382_9BILA|nr:hypothetical protein T10_4205 [Trichinella papuae]